MTVVTMMTVVVAVGFESHVFGGEDEAGGDHGGVDFDVM